MELQKRKGRGKEKEKGKERREERGRELHANAPWTVKQMHASLSSYMALFTFQSKDVSKVSISVNTHTAV